MPALQNKVTVSRNNPNLEANRNKTANITRLSKAPWKRKKEKAMIAPQVQIEKSLRVIGLPFLPVSLEEEEHAGMCAHVF